MEKLTLAQVLALLFLHVGGVAAVAAYCAVGAVIFPNLNDRATALLRGRLWLPALVGILISIPWAVAALLLISRGGRAGQLGAVIGIAWIIVGLVGCGALSRVIGSGRTSQPHDLDQPSMLRTTFIGGCILALTWAVPVLGWYGVMPLSLAMGVGCVALGARPHP